MARRRKTSSTHAAPWIYIVSGGTGSSGEGIVNTVLAQFPDSPARVVTKGNVHTRRQVEAVVRQASGTGGTIVHTMVDANLRASLIALAREQGVAEIDLMGPLLGRLREALGLEPLGIPGLYRQLRKDYFTRINAIEYTLAHDDGQDPGGWQKADVVLVGVSRSGKTPLSMYLSLRGLKAANYPLVPGIPVPDELSELEPRRVFGLVVDPDRLMKIRSERLAHFGLQDRTQYSDPARIEEEHLAARKIFRQGGFHVIDMSDKTIEASASEIMRLIGRIE